MKSRIIAYPTPAGLMNFVIMVGPFNEIVAGSRQGYNSVRALKAGVASLRSVFNSSPGTVLHIDWRTREEYFSIRRKTDNAKRKAARSRAK